MGKLYMCLGYFIGKDKSDAQYSMHYHISGKFRHSFELFAMGPCLLSSGEA